MSTRCAIGKGDWGTVKNVAYILKEYVLQLAGTSYCPQLASLCVLAHANLSISPRCRPYQHRMHPSISRVVFATVHNSASEVAAILSCP